jgi:hypothetical protein
MRSVRFQENSGPYVSIRFFSSVIAILQIHIEHSPLTAKGLTWKRQMGPMLLDCLTCVATQMESCPRKGLDAWLISEKRLIIKENLIHLIFATTLPLTLPFLR